jgi:hypothetical protein
MEEGKTTDELAGQAFALEARPGPGGVDAAQMVALMELVRKLKMVEDAKDGLCNLHGNLRQY